MANPAWSDMPTLYTTSQLRELSDDEVWTSMIDTAAASPSGTEALLPIAGGGRDPEPIPYVYDGKDLWHRGDLKMADMQRKIGARLAAMRQKSATTPATEEGASGS